jgi:hypothetical protein
MSDERQNIQLELALHCAGAGEAQTGQGQGTESRMVKGVTENPATERLMEEVCLPVSPLGGSTRRTAVYGTVRTVVWEGRSREAPPYPDWDQIHR